jgi:hypothetical protein
MHYIIEVNADGTRRRVYEKPEPVSAEHFIYVSQKGGKPMRIGVNQAKRRAHLIDKSDRLTVLAHLGSMPKESRNHQQLVLSRHRYYHDQHEEFVRGQNHAA